MVTSVSRLLSHFHVYRRTFIVYLCDGVQLFGGWAGHGASGEGLSDAAAAQHHQTQGGAVSGVRGLAGRSACVTTTPSTVGLSAGHRALLRRCRRTCVWWSTSRCCSGRSRGRWRKSGRRRRREASRGASLWGWREKRGKGSSHFSKTSDKGQQQQLQRTASATNLCWSETSWQCLQPQIWYIYVYICELKCASNQSSWTLY